MCNFCLNIESRNPNEAPVISFEHWDNGEIIVDDEWDFCPVFRSQDRLDFKKEKKEQTRYYNIDFDGIDGIDHWDDYPVCPENGYTEKAMFDDVRSGLAELGGGHADIWDAETDELFAEIEV